MSLKYHEYVQECKREKIPGMGGAIGFFFKKTALKIEIPQEDCQMWWKQLYEELQRPETFQPVELSPSIRRAQET